MWNKIPYKSEEMWINKKRRKLKSDKGVLCSANPEKVFIRTQ